MDDAHNDSATTSGIELGAISHATRRSSRSEPSAFAGRRASRSEPSPFGMGGMSMTPGSGSGSADPAPARPKLSTVLPTPPLTPVFDDDDDPIDFRVNLPDTKLAFDGSAEIGPSVPPTPQWRGSSEAEAGAYFDRELPSLPPVDGGRHALLFLLGATLTEGVVWGLPYSIGVLHEYWISTMFPGQSETTLTIASTLPTAMLQFLGMPLGPLFAAIPWHERKIQFLGLAVSSGALVASAFVTQPWQLVLTMGILYPASAAVYLPFAANIFQWFNKYIGLAGGTMICGTGIGGSIYPFVVSSLLKRYGYKATMISMGLSFGILLGPLIFLNVRRLPVSRITQRAPVPWSWLRHPSPWVAFGCILITALGINIPLVWVPSFAAVINATKPNGTALVAVMNAASVPGNLIAGALSDRFPVRKVMIAYCIVATAVTLVFWGALGTSQGALLAFAITWSLTAGCQPAMWPGMVNVIARGDSSVPQVAFGTLMSLRSVGTLTSGPLSTSLLKAPPIGTVGAFGQTNYGALILFVGVMQFGGAVMMLFFPGHNAVVL